MSQGGNVGLKPGTSTAADSDGNAAQLWTSNPNVNVTVSDSNTLPNEGSPLLPADSIIERPAVPSFTNELRASSPSSVRSMRAGCPTEFSHPAAVEEQRIIWLPEDPLGLVHDLEQELASHDILYASDGAEMDSQGKVTATFASPEDVRRASIPRPREREGEETGLFSFWDMMSIFQKYEARFRR